MYGTLLTSAKKAYTTIQGWIAWTAALQNKTLILTVIYLDCKSAFRYALLWWIWYYIKKLKILQKE